MSIPRCADSGAVRGLASFASVRAQVWSKVNWVLDQVNLYSLVHGKEPSPEEAEEEHTNTDEAEHDADDEDDGEVEQ